MDSLHNPSDGLFAYTCAAVLAGFAVIWAVTAFIAAWAQSLPKSRPPFYEFFRAYSAGAWFCAGASVMVLSARLGFGGPVGDTTALICVLGGPMFGFTSTTFAMRHIPYSHYRQ